MRFRALRFRRAPCSSRSSARSAGRRWRSRLVLAIGTALLLLAAARAAGATNPMLLGGVGRLGVASGLTRAGGHPADAVLPLIWILAAVDARRGHARRAGVLVGLSAGPRDVEDPRRRCAGPCATAPGSPGRHRGGGRHGSRPVSALPPRRPLLDALVRVAGDCAVAAVPVPPAGTPFGWSLRLAQGAVAVGAGAAVARLLHRSGHALWVVPLAIVAARLLLDPLLISYYLAAPKGPAFAGAAAGAAGLLGARRLDAPGAALGVS
jgi:hypothetical protein